MQSHREGQVTETASVWNSIIQQLSKKSPTFGAWLIPCEILSHCSFLQERVATNRERWNTKEVRIFLWCLSVYTRGLWRQNYFSRPYHNHM